MIAMLARLWSDEEGQDVAEYAVMLAVLIVLGAAVKHIIGDHIADRFEQIAKVIGGL